MRTLFWKLFGAFWLTTVAILAVSIFVTFQLAGESHEGLSDPREIDLVLQEVLQDAGLKGLRNYLADAGNFPPGRTVYLIDPSGRELLDRAVPERTAERARRMRAVHAAHEERGHRSQRSRRELQQQLLQTPDGQKWLAMPGPAPLPRFGILSFGNLRWAVLGLAAVISLLSFWLLSRSLTRPVARISDAAARLAGGDMSARVGTGSYGGDEIGTLAKQFDRMAAELETQSTTRRELFRNIAHEIRAPLTRLQIATELLERQPERTGDHVERIRYEIDRVENLTRQVLQLARAEQLPNSAETASLIEIITRIAADATFEAEALGVELVCEASSDEIMIKGNAEAIASAVENVVRNAVQFTPAGGKVIITVEQGSLCRLVVSDTGPGVADGQLQKIFEPFYRIDTNRPGAGIGLAISQRVLGQVGGELSASNLPGGGLSISMGFQYA
jgi:two-component system sensor histidine kinase CpxA